MKNCLLWVLGFHRLSLPFFGGLGGSASCGSSWLSRPSQSYLIVGVDNLVATVGRIGYGRATKPGINHVATRVERFIPTMERPWIQLFVNMAFNARLTHPWTTVLLLILGDP
jgi:hypothetical protein